VPKAIREIYGETLRELGALNPDIVVLDADLSGSTKSGIFGKAYPDRFFNMGIAESNMCAAAAGLASVGKIPFVNTFAAFLTTLGLISIRAQSCYGNLNVKFAGAYCGMSDALDGATHHACEDIAIMRSLPNMRVIVPSDAASARWAAKLAADIPGPVYLRLSRDVYPDLYNTGAGNDGGSEPDSDTAPSGTAGQSGVASAGQLNLASADQFSLGGGAIVREGTDVTVIACGLLTHKALEAAEDLAGGGVSVRVVDMYSIKPIDEALILKCARETGAIVCAEEHSIIGGLGGAVAEVLCKHGAAVPTEFVGIRDTFTESAPYAQLLAKYGVDAAGVRRGIETVLGHKK